MIVNVRAVRNAVLVSLGLLAAGAGTAQDPSRAMTPTARLHELKALSTVDRYVAPDMDLTAVAQEDEQRAAAGLPPRFAIPHPTMITPDNGGTFEQLDPKTKVWRMVISAPGAVSLNLGFGQYDMPRDGRLMVYAADYSHIHRPFTAADNAEHGELWTPIVLSDEIVVEVTAPSSQFEELGLALTSVNVGYRGFAKSASEAASGSCNVDVVCPEGDDWRLDIPSVAVISTGGYLFCTGFMVNNTAEDLTPYFMTAAHCGIGAGNAPSLVAYWNYENSWCRPPGSPSSGGSGDGALSQYNTGAYWRATYSPSDMTLVELDSDPDPAWEVSYAGWDHSGDDPPMAIAIHHPDTAEKRISFEYDPTSTTSYLGYASPGDGTHIRITDWDLGTTEPGSSGSPLFDEQHRVVGQLHGGYASCTSQTSDWYGRFSVSWNGGGTESTRLRDWLDAAGTGAVTVDTVSLATLCSSAGEVAFDRATFGCDDVAQATVIDCDLNLSEVLIDTVQIVVTSDTEPAGEVILLTETGINSSKFSGTVAVSVVDAAGVLHVAAGDTIRAVYDDADDGSGSPATVEATAEIDCTPPNIFGVNVEDVAPRSATVTFNTDEATAGTVHYGLSCGTLWQETTEAGYVKNQQIELTGLDDGLTYFFAVSAADEAGNEAYDDNGGACYTFQTSEAPDYYTELFNGDNDLDNVSITFTPTGGTDFYDGCVTAITELPTSPTLGTTLSFSPNNDDGFAHVTLGGGETVTFYGVSYGGFYVGTNGYVTFVSGDTDYTETLGDHFAQPRISALFDDLDPSSGGAVRWIQLADRAVVTYNAIREYNAGTTNTFQIELYFDGRIVMSYLSVAAGDGIAGLSMGGGTDPEFVETDLSALGECQPPDCNDNGVPDAEDIAAGTSQDCNGNTVPDECDVAEGASEDCDGNGIPDECDLAGGAADCNENGTLDSCDVAGGASPDEDGNGVPDECQIAAPLVVVGSCRCFTVSPMPADATLPVALAIDGAVTDETVACLSLFVQPDGTLGNDPVYRLAAEWGEVHVVDQRIVPDATYEVRERLASGVVTSPVSADTWTWGDVDANGTANFVDVLILVHGFQGDFSDATLDAMDIWPCVPDGTVNFEDIQHAVRAFQGVTYADESCPMPCP